MEPRIFVADPASVGAAQAMRDTEERRARKRLAADRASGDLNWFGLVPTAERGKYPRPHATYRCARRNAARAAGWPDRRRVQ
jgi:hypothetical protein